MCFLACKTCSRNGQSSCHHCTDQPSFFLLHPDWYSHLPLTALLYQRARQPLPAVTNPRGNFKKTVECYCSTAPLAPHLTYVDLQGSVIFHRHPFLQPHCPCFFSNVLPPLDPLCLVYSVLGYENGFSPASSNVATSVTLFPFTALSCYAFYWFSPFNSF